MATPTGNYMHIIAGLFIHHAVTGRGLTISDIRKGFGVTDATAEAIVHWAMDRYDIVPRHNYSPRSTDPVWTPANPTLHRIAARKPGYEWLSDALANQQKAA